MKSRRLTIRSWIVTGAVAFLPAAWALPQQDQPDFTIHSDVRLVVLDVGVKDHKGGLVSGLSKDNFTILEDGRPQPIQVFVTEDAPVTVGILVDESFSMRPKRNAVLTAAQLFVEASNPADEIFVLHFNEKVSRGLPTPQLFSGDPNQLYKALQRGVPEGKTALHDAVVQGLEQLKLGKYDKKALVLVSDGGDNASEHSRAQMLDEATRSSATIYTIGIYEPDDPDRNPGILRELSRISGGEAFFPASPPDTLPVCRKIARDIRS